MFAGRFAPAPRPIALVGPAVAVLLLRTVPADATSSVVRLTTNQKVQGETAVAVSGANDDVMVVAYNDGRKINGGKHQNMGYAYTTDGGATTSDWNRNLYIQGITQSDPTGLRWPAASDPVLVYSAKDDTFKAAIIGIVNNSSKHKTAVVFASSSKTAVAPPLSWGAPVNIGPSVDTQTNPGSSSCSGTWTDKPSMTVDNDRGSPYYGRVYASWQERDCGDTNVQVWASHHDVGVPGWSPAVDVSFEAFDNIGSWSPSIRVGGADGKVYVAYCYPVDGGSCRNGSLAQVLVAASTDGGATWTHAGATDTFVPVPDPIPVPSPLPPFEFTDNSNPVLTVDPNDSSNLHMVFASFDSATGTDVDYVHSTDGGKSWSSPIMLGTSGPHDQFLPWLAESSDGSILWACYYTDGDSYPHIDVSCVKSIDGVTFGSPTSASTFHFDPGSSTWIGDYMAVAVGANGGYRAAWSGYQACCAGVNLDVYFRRT